jgi:hypothetical protein
MDYWLKTWGNVPTSPFDQDRDRDGLKDSDEPNMIGLNGEPYAPNKWDTNDDGKSDFEDYACTIEDKWQKGYADEEDWAHPGHQCNKYK